MIPIYFLRFSSALLNSYCLYTLVPKIVNIIAATDDSIEPDYFLKKNIKNKYFLFLIRLQNNQAIIQPNHLPKH